MFETLVTLSACSAYFGANIAQDIRVDVADFLKIWDMLEDDRTMLEDDRTIGKVTLEETLELIMRAHDCYSKGILDEVVRKRIESRSLCFSYLHPEILPMLSEIKKHSIKIGLISNCFSEEVIPIRKSELLPYFDAVYLSYEQGIQKPDKEIFIRCMAELDVNPQECIYVGDGGSHELETAEELGMNVFQALWYFTDDATLSSKRKESFSSLATPCDLLRYI